MPIVEGLDQQTPEWLQTRCGMVTASRVAAVLAVLKRKDSEAAVRRDYRNDIVVETLIGRATESYVSPAMEWGIDTEPLAAAAYEVAHNVELEPGGFWIHDRINRFGASPDRLLGEDGLVEIKCPTTAVHLEYFMGGVVPAEYGPQILAELACTNRAWCDFVSFDPRLPKFLRLFVRRYHRDEGVIGAMEKAVEQFLAEVDETLEKLKAAAKTEEARTP